MKTTQDILKQLDNFYYKEKDGYVEVSLPVALWMNCNAVVLRIKPTPNGYIITDTGDNFKEFNNNASFYYDRFLKNCKYTYDIKLDGETLYKEYAFNTSIIVGIDEFVRFLIRLDDYILDSNLRAV